MIDFDYIRQVVVTGLKKHLGCPVVKQNQNAEPPSYPYCSYMIPIPKKANKGTFGVYDDGIHRKECTQTWSITIQSEDDSECVRLASKANEWFDYVGLTYLNDNGIIVQSVGDITNRDNILTVDFEYRKGFDVVFWMHDEIENPTDETGWIEKVEFGNSTIEYTDPAEKLEARLDGDL